MSATRSASLRSDSQDVDGPFRPGLCDSLARPWDSYDAYLFDVDGTLLECRDAVHYYAFVATLQMLSGRKLDLTGITAHGNTDVGILRDALALAGIADEAWRPRAAEARAAMCAFVEQHRAEILPVVLPGVRRTLSHLRRRGALLGVATGNLEAIGRLKLERCGLFRHFHFGAFSDAFECRREVFLHAVARVRELLGNQASVCVFGDTPADIEAAQSCGVEVIAVATGVHTREQLVASGPNLCLSSLRHLFLAKNVPAHSCG